MSCVACALRVELDPLDFREFWSDVSNGSKSENSGKTNEWLHSSG